MSIAARNAILAGGGWKNPYITDGIMCMFDGFWNVGGGLYDQNSRTWVDLAGNGYDVTLQNGSTGGDFYDHALRCHGGVAAYGNKAIQNQNTLECYCECVFSLSSNLYSTDVGVIFGNSVSVLDTGVSTRRHPANGIWYDFRTQYSRTRFMYGNPWGKVADTSIRPFPSGLHRLCASETVNILDGVDRSSQSSSEISYLAANSDELIYEGITFGNLRYKTGQEWVLPCKSGTLVHALRVYDHNLSVAEMVHNKAVDQARFGIS